MTQYRKSPLLRPEPIYRRVTHTVNAKSAAKRVASRLIAGDEMIITDHFRTGLSVLYQLKAQLGAPPTTADHPTRRAFKRVYQEASQRLLVPIKDLHVALADAPPSGFLSALYSDVEKSDFALPFEEVRRLNAAWSRYKRGVRLNVLGHDIHPFYGTYSPTRLTHLELFGTWLSQHKGDRKLAVDVGTGSGVLALMLCKAGYKHVIATDCSPNAIESVYRERQRLSPRPPISLREDDLLSTVQKKANLIVFNPPWMRGPIASELDRALYFEDGLFERFFEQATTRLSPNGRVLLIFSSLIQLVQPDVPHPIKAELDRGRFQLVQKLQRRVKSSKQSDGERRRTRERVEIWELKLKH